MRVLKDHQMLDGCCEVGDQIDFRIPLKGLHTKYLTPTARNVFNKFSVRWFIRFVIKIAPEAKADETKKPDDSESEEKEEQPPEDVEIDSNFIEIVLWR